MSARRRRAGAAFDATVLIELGFVLALAAVAAYAAWPIYETSYLFVTVAGAVAIGAGVSIIGFLQRWSWLTTVLTTMAAYLVLGVPLAVPRAFGSRAAFVQAYPELISATVFDWKKLITIDLPVGHFQTLLVPLLVVMLVSVTVAFSLTLHRVRAYAVVVPVMLAPTAFALAFGSRSIGRSWVVAGFPIGAPSRMLVGVLALGLAGAFLVWRAQHARTVALRAVAAETGVRRAGGSATGVVRRTAGAIAVALVALLVAVPLSSTALAPRDREVLRTAIDPTQQLSGYVSPLTEYRESFDAANFDRPIVTVSGDLAAVGRLRLATMSSYDGQQYTVLSSDSDRQHAFTRIPQLTTTPRGSGLVSARVSIGTLAGPWLPTAAGMQAIDFHGANTNALTDGFYYNRRIQAGVELGKLQAGDSYTLTAAPTPAGAPDLASVTAAPGTTPDTAQVPKSLSAWIAMQHLGTDGAALAELISRLRERGYLSHSLEQPTAPAADNWLAQLPGAVFEPSRAGESMDRIGAMFTALMQQQNAAPDADSAQLVAAVGDDEQFAVASALIAQSLGFPARVVLGFDLVRRAGDSGAIPACEDGICRGKNLTAWIEVEDADGSWVAADTTPQYADQLATRPVTNQQPKLPTQVQQRGARVQPPPEANPTGNDRQSDQSSGPRHDGPARWLPVLRIGGSILLVLMVLAAPLVSIVVVKLARRRERRRAANTAQRMAAGWDELVDTALDLGLPAPGVRTRTEAATVYAVAARATDPERMRTLASGADEAVFGAFDPTAEQADQYWARLDEQRSRLAAGFPRWRRLWALISLRSFRPGGGGGA